MSNSIAELEPVHIWRNFAALNAVPRPSKKEEKVIQFMMAFGKTLGLETERDASGNVLIRKPATAGMEDRKTVVLQAHLDMVHQKNNNTEFNFDTQGIQMYTDGDWVRAKGTTLGADNGLGVAAIMGVLESSTLIHPPLEALFTIDEETGMTGAKNLNKDWLKGEILLNLDTEEDDELGIGCAGGVDITASGTYQPIASGIGMSGIRLQIKGLSGGHSGMDIHKGLGNANKLMTRLLYACQAEQPFGLNSFQGGNLRNAIPRESVAVIALENSGLNQFEKAFQKEREAILSEFLSRDPNITIEMEAVELPKQLMSTEDQTLLLRCLYSVHNGVFAMSHEFPEMTETSNNLAQVRVEEGSIRAGCLCRSSRESAKKSLSMQLEATFALAGYRVEMSGDYPGWLPEPESEILQLVSRRYEHLYGDSPRKIAGHGGLECGILKDHYPEMDMISFGPTIHGAHSPDERASVSSSMKFWKWLCDVLENIPKQA
ncbi:aminoacyl-histidine dipeptidase [Robiginitalea sp. IMCC43444]|uniref:aminoacyl-histidine dipeptidase n=1 Tax=Robiginitalea sp. IMCC43444 TaxID=3459121 RepID=UPI004041B9B3